MSLWRIPVLARSLMTVFMGFSPLLKPRSRHNRARRVTRSVANDDHLAASLVGLHDAVSLTDLVEPEDPGRLDVEPAGRSVRSNLLKRHIRERKAWSAEHEAAEESQIDTARHLQQRVEVGNWIEAAEPAGKTGTAATAKHGERVERDAVAYQVEHRIDLLCVGDMLRQIAALSQ